MGTDKGGAFRALVLSADCYLIHPQWMAGLAGSVTRRPGLLVNDSRSISGERGPSRADVREGGGCVGAAVRSIAFHPMSRSTRAGALWGPGREGGAGGFAVPYFSLALDTALGEEFSPECRRALGCRKGAGPYLRVVRRIQDQVSQALRTNAVEADDDMVPAQDSKTCTTRKGVHIVREGRRGIAAPSQRSRARTLTVRLLCFVMAARSDSTC